MKLWPREIAAIRRSTEPARQYANRLGVPVPLINAIRQRRAYRLATQSPNIASFGASNQPTAPMKKNPFRGIAVPTHNVSVAREGKRGIEFINRPARHIDGPRDERKTYRLRSHWLTDPFRDGDPIPCAFIR